MTIVRPRRPNARMISQSWRRDCGIQTRRGLVEKEQFGIAHEGARDGEPLALASRELPDPGGRLVGQADRRHDRRRLDAAPVEAAEERQHFEDRQFLGEPGLLQGDAQALAQVVVMMPPTPAQHLDVTRGRLQQPLEDFDRGRLAGAVRAQQPETLSAPNLEVEAVDRVHGTGLRGVVLREAMAAHGGRGRCHLDAHPVPFRGVEPPLRPLTPGPSGPRALYSCHHLAARGAHTTVTPPWPSHPVSQPAARGLLVTVAALTLAVSTSARRLPGAGQGPAQAAPVPSLTFTKDGLEPILAQPKLRGLVDGVRTACGGAVPVQDSDVPYGIGSWDADVFGNHRAVLRRRGAGGRRLRAHSVAAARRPARGPASGRRRRHSRAAGSSTSSASGSTRSSAISCSRRRPPATTTSTTCRTRAPGARTTRR